MKYGEETTLKRSFFIQKRVIGALLMREIITRYGRRNLGFIWLFAEPLFMTALIVALWSSFRAEQYSDLNITAFMITGYPLMMMWRSSSNSVMSAISANVSLLYHRNVRVLDTILARLLLDITGATIAQITLMGLCIILGYIPMPQDIFYMILAWALMAMFATGLGLILCSIAYYIEIFKKLWGILSFIMLPLSGAFFLVYTLPPQIQEYLLWVPMIHGTEMFRHGYFGDSIITLESPSYLLLLNLILILIGLLMVRKFSKGVDLR